MSQQVIPYTIPPEPHQWRSVVMALLVHLALLAFFWVGLSWQSLTPTTVEAEIWDVTPHDAAPPPPPEPEPEPEPVPEPPKQTPKSKPPVPKVAPEPPKVKAADPDIALEQEKKRKQQKEKEKLAEEKQKREELEKKQLAEEQKRQKEEQALKDKKKLEEEQKRKQEAAAEEQKRRQEQVAEKPKKTLRSAEDMDLIQGQAGDGETGTGEKKSGAPGSACELYIGKTVKSNISFPDMPGNPMVTVKIRLNSSRMLEDVKVVSPSENPAFDRQVERGIRKSAQFPPECPEEFMYSQSLKPR